MNFNRKDNSYKYIFIGSTGRTATTFISSVFNSLDNVVGLHEGKSWLCEKFSHEIPMINLENRICFHYPDKAHEVVLNKRNTSILNSVINKHDATILCEVAYYNSVIATALLDYHTQGVFIGIKRGCESFVRSATTMFGEDLMPAGWPDASKTLSDREKFISLGRLKPKKSDADYVSWDGWSAIRKNIWLWKATNTLILKAKMQHPDRVVLVDFEDFLADQLGFFQKVLSFSCNITTDQELLSCKLDEVGASAKNSKIGGYQIPKSDLWTDDERYHLMTSEKEINTMWERYK